MYKPNHTRHLDSWPSDPLAVIKEILRYPAEELKQSQFKFDTSTKSAEHNWLVLQRHPNLGAALLADGNSALRYGSEFKRSSKLSKLFSSHPLWHRVQNILDNGITYPLSPLSTEMKSKDLIEGLEFGNHKGTEKFKQCLHKLIDSDISHGYSLILPRRVATLIPDALLAPLNIIEQNTITELGEIAQKRRLVHNQSKVFSASGTSVNSRTDKDMLQGLMYGHCITRLVHYTLAIRRTHPNKRILISKIDYKSAYRRAHLNWKSAIQSITQVDEFLQISLRATFGGTPNPYEWCTISESVTDLANLLINTKEWNPKKLHAPIQDKFPSDEYLPDDVPMATSLPTIVSPPVDCCVKADVYIDDTPTIAVDDPPSLDRARAAVLLAIHIITRQLSPNEHILRDDIACIKKLLGEGALSEIKVILGWEFDTRRLLIRLPNNKFQAWTNCITKILDENSTNHNTLDTLIGQLTHVSAVMHPLLHFLSRLRSLKFKASRRRSVKLEQKHRDDLEIALKMLKKANNGISMNLLSFRKPTLCYRADACPWGIGGYNSKGRAWRWELPTKLRWRATLNMLEFVAAVIGPWIDIIENNLPPMSCILSMTDSTTTNGWLRRSNFNDCNQQENAEQNQCKLELARKHASLLLDNSIKDYSQWFPGQENDVSDCLSRDFHLNNNDITHLLFSSVPSQLPLSFEIAPLPQEIESFLYAWLQKMPAGPPSNETRARSGLRPGHDGPNFLPPSNSNLTNSSTTSTKSTSPNSSHASPNLSEKPSILQHLSTSWLQEQSALPWTMWLRPSGLTSDPTHDSTQTVSLHAYYNDSTQAIRKRILQQNNKKRSQHQSFANSKETNPLPEQ